MHKEYNHGTNTTNLTSHKISVTENSNLRSQASDPENSDPSKEKKQDLNLSQFLSP